MTDYLTVVEVLAMHADQIERYGGSYGVRDPGLLEASLFRRQTGYYADLVEEGSKTRPAQRARRRPPHHAITRCSGQPALSGRFTRPAAEE